MMSLLNKRAILPWTAILTIFIVGLAFAAGLNNGYYRAAADTDRSLIPRPPAVKGTSVAIGPQAQIERVVVKFAEGTRARLVQNDLVSLSGKDLREANALIRRYTSGPVKRLADKRPDEVEKEKARLERRCGRQLADLNNYITIEVTSPAEAERLVNLLNRLSEVEIAYAEPRSVPAGDIAPTTPDYESRQDYLRAAPTGIDADYAHTISGGDGSGVTIVDIEGNWRFDHEDLETAVGGLIGGELLDDINWRNHGTAVIGEMIGGDNGYGVTGIVPNAAIRMVSIGGSGVPEAILLAVDSLVAGDVILIELQAPGPRYNFQVRSDQLGYICEEYWQATFDAIQLAWAKGITVCEAAGNGYENLDDPIYENRFDTTFRNSHAILCGAGAPPSGNYGTDRSRLLFSNYGERVNLQGQGQEVTTTGYGYLFSGAGDERQYYTGSFAGTSSAAPIVTGAVAAMQGIYQSRYAGMTLDPDQVRDVLIATGSPQQANAYQHIGPRPNLRAADSALPPPADLAVTPGYLDTSVTLGTQLAVSLELHNRSVDLTLEYSAIVWDSLTKSGGNWLTVVSPAGTIAPQATQGLDLILDAGMIEDRTWDYKGMIQINYGEQGGPLDRRELVPVFVTVPCADTMYAPSASTDPGGRPFQWVDITGIGFPIPSYSWYNPFVTDEVIDDGTAGPFAIGFAFPFYDTTFTRVYLGANGALSFTDENVNVEGYYTPVPIPNPPFATFVSPFWNDLNLDHAAGGHGTVYLYRAPHNDTLIFEYYQVGNFQSPDDTLTTFEVILTKNGSVTFQYLSVGTSSLADSAVIGIARYDCEAVPYLIQGNPAGHIVADSTAVLFDYAPIIWEMAGDANRDDAVNVGDVVYLVNWIFKGGPAPMNLSEADVNCDGQHNVADAVYLINFVFKSGPGPCLYPL
jgi:hypothetical protein